MKKLLYPFALCALLLPAAARAEAPDMEAQIAALSQALNEAAHCAPGETSDPLSHFCPPGSIQQMKGPLGLPPMAHGYLGFVFNFSEGADIKAALAKATFGKLILQSTGVRMEPVKAAKADLMAKLIKTVREAPNTSNFKIPLALMKELNDEKGLIKMAPGEDVVMLSLKGAPARLYRLSNMGRGEVWVMLVQEKSGLKIGIYPIFGYEVPPLS